MGCIQTKQRLKSNNNSNNDSMSPSDSQRTIQNKKTPQASKETVQQTQQINTQKNEPSQSKILSQRKEQSVKKSGSTGTGGSSSSPKNQQSERKSERSSPQPLQKQNASRRRKKRRRKAQINFYDESQHNKKVVMVKTLISQERVAFVTLCYFKLRELLKLGQVCKRFYWLTGNQDLITEIQRNHGIRNASFILMGPSAGSTEHKFALRNEDAVENRPGESQRKSPHLMLARGSSNGLEQVALKGQDQLLQQPSGPTHDQLAHELFSMNGSECFVEFPGLLNDDDEHMNDVIEINDINFNFDKQQPIDTHGFEIFKEADGPLGEENLQEDSDRRLKKNFYETAKFNPRSLIELCEVTVSSCNEAEDEAHLPEIQFFNQSSRMRFRSIRQMDEYSHRLSAASYQDKNRSYYGKQNRPTTSPQYSQQDTISNGSVNNLSARSIERLQQPIKPSGSLQLNQYSSLEASRGPIIHSHQVFDKNFQEQKIESVRLEDTLRAKVDIEQTTLENNNNQPTLQQQTQGTTQHVYIYANEISIKFDNGGIIQTTEPAQNSILVNNNMTGSSRGEERKDNSRQGYSQTGKLALPSISELEQIDDLMVGINNGSGMLAVTGRLINSNGNNGDGHFQQNAAYQTQASHKVSENCFSTYNTPKFTQGYEFFPQLQVKKNPHFGQMSSSVGSNVIINNSSSQPQQYHHQQTQSMGLAFQKPPRPVSDQSRQERQFQSQQQQQNGGQLRESSKN